MENTEGSEGTRTKISDSAYSNSCGNSQSQRSGSSKSHHSGSNSSGSSGYGGKTSSSLTKSNDAGSQASSKRKDKKNKTKCQNDISPIQELAALRTSVSSSQFTERGEEEPSPPVSDPVPSPEIVAQTVQKEETFPVPECPVPKEQNVVLGESVGPPILDIAPLPLPSTADDVRAVQPFEPMDEQQQPLTVDCSTPVRLPADLPVSINTKPNITVPLLDHLTKSHPTTDGFTCVVSMRDGVILYTNYQNLTESLGYPKEMWIGRSFIDFIHPKDRSLFANHTTSGVAMTFGEPIISRQKDLPRTSLFCRIRKYRGLNSLTGMTNFGVRDKELIYIPYKLTLSFRDINEFDNKEIYMVVSASTVASPFEEGKIKNSHFISRYKANGIISHIEPIAPLGFLPQDIIGHSIFDFYHPEDMPYLKEIYAKLSTTENSFRSKPYRLCTQNGDYLTIESDWSTFVNPWSRKIEFITCNNEIIESPANMDVFNIPKFKINQILWDDIIMQSKVIKDEILRGLSELMVKSSESNRQVISKRCKNLATFMEHLVDDTARSEELCLEVPDKISLSGRDSVMLGEISPHHDDCDGKSSTVTPQSYSQMNYNENLQRFFESKPRTIIPNLSCPQQKVTVPDICFHEPVQVDTQVKYNTPMQLVSPESGANERSGPFEKYCVKPLYHPVPRYMCETNKMSLTIDYKPVHLTEELLSKHNSVMEKLMVKKHRESRFVSKASERDKGEKRDKRNEYTKPCLNVIPNHIVDTYDSRPEHGLKRSRPMMWDTEVNHKVSKKTTPAVNPVLQMNMPAQTSPVTAAVASSNGIMSGACLNSVTTPTTMHNPSEQLITGHPGVVNLWPPFSVTMPPIQSATQTTAGPSYQNTENIQYPGMYPAVYFISPQHPQIPVEHSVIPKSSPYPVPYMMYPPPVFSSQAFMYPQMAMGYQPVTLNATPITTQVSSVPSMAPNTKMHNYQQACQLPTTSVDSSGMGMAMQGGLRHYTEINIPKPPNPTATTQESRGNSLKVDTGSAMESLTSATMKRQLMTPPSKTKFRKNGTVSSHMMTYDNDGEASSYSSFYSPFLKTHKSDSTGYMDSVGEPSNSVTTFKDKDYFIADDRSCTTNEAKTRRVLQWRQAGPQNAPSYPTSSKKSPKTLNQEKNTPTHETKKTVPTNNAPPPCLDPVCLTSDLLYRYQLTEKKLEDVLKSDLNSLHGINQPPLVNEQLSQLYKELQIEGISEKLKLDEGITSSSGEEGQLLPENKKKREYAKLGMIYEENAPMPSPTKK